LLTPCRWIRLAGIAWGGLFIAMKSKLTEDQVREIHALCDGRVISDSAIGAMYGVSNTTVSDIKNGNTWRRLVLGPCANLQNWKTRSIRQRILDGSKLNLVSGCWEWQHGTLAVKYGGMKILGKSKYVHRLAYEEFVMPIPKGMFVCHLCDNPICCNPDHLFLGTNKDNMDDKVAKGRQQRGSKQVLSKLKENDVVKIVEMLMSGLSQTSVAAVFGISKSVVSSISTGRAWRHVTGFASPPSNIQHPGA
jgi:hypothetical protein